MTGVDWISGRGFAGGELIEGLTGGLVVWVKTKDLLELGFCPGHPALAGQFAGQSKMAVRVVRPDLDGFAKLFQGGGGTVHPGQQAAQAGVEGGLVWLEAAGALAFVQSRFKFSLAGVDVAQFEPGGRHARIQSHRPAKGRFRQIGRAHV